MATLGLAALLNGIRRWGLHVRAFLLIEASPSPVSSPALPAAQRRWVRRGGGGWYAVEVGFLKLSQRSPQVIMRASSGHSGVGSSAYERLASDRGEKTGLPLLPCPKCGSEVLELVCGPGSKVLGAVFFKCQFHERDVSPQCHLFAIGLLFLPLIRYCA